MLLKCLFAAFAICSFAVCKADDVEERRQVALQIVEEKEMGGALSDENLKKMLMPNIEEMISKLHLSDAEAQTFRKAAVPIVTSVSSKDLMKIAADSYAEHLTLSELKATLEFFKTPAGRALNKQASAVNATMMQKNHDFFVELGKKTKSAYEDLKNKEK